MTHSVLNSERPPKNIKDIDKISIKLPETSRKLINQVERQIFLLYFTRLVDAATPKRSYFSSVR